MMRHVLLLGVLFVCFTGLHATLPPQEVLDAASGSVFWSEQANPTPTSLLRRTQTVDDVGRTLLHAARRGSASPMHATSSQWCVCVCVCVCACACVLD